MISKMLLQEIMQMSIPDSIMKNVFMISKITLYISVFVICITSSLSSHKKINNTYEQ